MNQHDFSKKDHKNQYPAYWTTSKPKKPKPLTSLDLPKLNLRYYTDEIPSDENNLINESTRAYIEKMKKVVL